LINLSFTKDSFYCYRSPDFDATTDTSGQQITADSQQLDASQQYVIVKISFVDQNFALDVVQSPTFPEWQDNFPRDPTLGQLLFPTV